MVTRKEAAYALDNELTGLELDAEKAMAALKEITEKYFDSPDIKQSNAKMRYEFDRCAVFANIAVDYVFRIAQCVGAIQRAEEVK